MPDLVRARELFRLSNEIHLDLITGTQAYRTFSLPVFKGLLSTPHIAAGITRLCVFHVVLTLAKWQELYDRYKQHLPVAVADEAKQLRRELEKRELRVFRNTFVGHIWDDDTKRPLTIPEVDMALAKVMSTGIAPFMDWVNEAESSTGALTVALIVEHIRNAVQVEHGLTDADLG